MRSKLIVVTFVAVCSLLSAQARTYADAPEVDRQLSLRLDAALREDAHASRSRNTWASISDLILGGVSIAAGIGIATDDAAHWGKSRSSAVLTGVALSIGAGLLVHGISRWLGSTAAEQRLERWNQLDDAAQRDPAEIARFEGELALAADASASDRVGHALFSIGYAAGGGAMIGVAATSAFAGKPRTEAYVFGGAAAFFGILQFTGYLLHPTPTEDTWRKYSVERARLLENRPGRSRLSELQLRAPAAL